MKTISYLHTPYGSYRPPQFKIVEGTEEIGIHYQKGLPNNVSTHKVYRVFNTDTNDLIAKVYAGIGVSVTYDTIKNDSK